MSDPRSPSPFINLAAVEAWDTWFRWRDGARLHDLSIEDTWSRVATTLASVEAPREAADWKARFTDALSSWRLLPDERLLADAGTGRITWHGGGLYGVLNAAAFVSSGRCQNVALALPALADCASVAVRALDNAALLAGAPSPALYIGFVGVADALALLGLAYDSDAGRAQAAAMAQALAEGALRGSVKLAADRGRCADAGQAAVARAVARGVPPGLLQDMTRYGLRHVQLTALTSQPRLALLANNVADAVDPLRGRDQIHAISGAGGQRVMRSPGYASSVMAARADSHADSEAAPETSLRAQLALRAAMQPWVDAPIACPLLALHDPDDAERREVMQQAARHGLGTPAWRGPARLLRS